MLVKILIFIFAFLIMQQFLVETQIIEGFKLRDKKVTPLKKPVNTTSREKSTEKVVVGTAVATNALMEQKYKKLVASEKKRCQNEINAHKSKIQNLEEQLANLEKAKELEDTEIDLDMDIIEEL